MAESVTNVEELLSGFSKLTLEQRYARLKEMGLMSSQDIQFLKKGGIKEISLGEKFIENVLGYMQLPMGVAVNLKMDGEDVILPLAVEETSIVAALSKTSKWVRSKGKVTTESRGTDIIGQIQIAKVKDVASLEALVAKNSKTWVEKANKDVAHGLVNRGGGVTSIELRILNRPDEGQMAVIHVHADPCDAMGANIMNQVCEYLKPIIEHESDENVTMCILSNLVDTKLSYAKVEIADVDSELGIKIQEASIFAEIDPYRAATHNKGVMNGVDPILIATGNDWRAVEAGVHAYAARDGQYRSVTKWRYNQDRKILTGEFEAPIVVGTVGGVTKLHPTAQIALKIMGVENAAHLGRICAAAGLIQNLGALKALTTVGIIEGHMKLHIKNLSLGAGASDEELPMVARKLEEILTLKKRISLAHAVEVLKEIRSKTVTS
jgi:hydroxymethylglutaryl-CoA reductase